MNFQTITFNQLLQSHTGFLKGFAMHLTKNKEDAIDLYQETLYRAIKNEDKFLPGSNQKAWLSTIMKNLFINMYRKRKKEKIVKEPIGSNHDYAEFFSKSERNNGEIKITLDEINREIEDLPTDFGLPMKMMIDGHKYEEIAEHLMIPIGTVKSRLHQARKQLQLRIMNKFNIKSHSEF